MKKAWTRLGIVAAALMALQSAPALTQSSDALLTAETTYWQSISAENDADLYRDYLDKVASGAFPGTYRAIAEKRLKALGGTVPVSAPPAPLPPPPPPPAPKIATSTTQANTKDGAELAKQGNAAWERGDYAESFRLNTLAAQMGNAVGMRQLGYLYANGEGTTRNEALGFSWVEKSAKAGDPDGMLMLGTYYDNGVGTPKDSPMAVYWFEQGATAGKTLGMVLTGLAYISGKGVDPEPAKALFWLEKAANAGDRWGMTELGTAYYNGDLGAKDYTKAHFWLQKGASAGDAASMRMLGALYYQGHGVAKDFVTAYQWFDKADKAGNTAAKLYLGQMYEFGEGVPQDYAKARQYYRAAFDGGYEGEVGDILGSMYLMGRGGPADGPEAVRVLTRAYDKGNVKASGWLGVIYSVGTPGVDKTPALALDWYRKGAEKGDASQMAEVGRMYAMGEGVTVNPALALDWAQRSADAGHYSGQLLMGEFYYLYHSPPIAKQDYAKALHYFTLAAGQKNADAAIYLSQLYFNGFGVQKNHDTGLSWVRKAAEWGSRGARDWLKANGY